MNKVGIGTSALDTQLDVEGDIKISASSLACSPARAGTLRWNGSQFQGCNGAVWLTLAGFDASIPTVASSGHTWMDRNLGASQVATSSSDSAAFGDLYQWGRFADGHEKRTSSTTTTLSTTDTPGHGNFIISLSTPYDWRTPQNDNLWQGVSGINNPCPAGFRVPTFVEWESERTSWSSNDAAGAFASPLKLVMAGYRHLSTGSIYDAGGFGYYWSSTASGTNSRGLYLGNVAVLVNNVRANGLSIRCLKD